MLADMAFVQPRAPRSASSSDDGHGSDVSRAPSSQEPYYSNNDIRALHDIVVAAQELLDASPEPKPLPAAALFKAYDEVLPKYGIDPDSDHHISTFVFRVGGERGDGSLIDKFQIILSRMGIVLEFGDNDTTTSSRTSQSNSPDFSPASGKNQPNHYTRTVESASINGETPKAVQPLIHRIHEERNHEGQQDEDEEDYDMDDGESISSYEREQVALAAKRAAMSSVMDRWRALVARRQSDESRRAGPLSTVIEESTIPRTLESRVESPQAPTATVPEMRSRPPGDPLIEEYENKEDTDQQTLERPPPTLPSLTDRWRSLTANTQTGSLVKNGPRDRVETSSHARMNQVDDRMEPKQAESNEELAKRMLLAPRTSTGITDPEPQTLVDHEEKASIPLRGSEESRHRAAAEERIVYATPPNKETQQSTAEAEAKQQRKLLKRAARAREIYLASKFFNRWADITARRIERDAVARRHMIRFRCFRGWSQAPPSREPAADHLRAATCVKKWQRSIAEHDNHLKALAEATARAYHLKKAQKILTHWRCQRLEDVARSQAASRMRTRVLTGWMIQSSKHMVAQKTARTEATRWAATSTLDKWQDQAARGELRDNAAKRIGAVQQSFSHLREWWDQAEISRRARTYRQNMLLKKATHAFTQWNLQARAQAFVWRREYLAVNRAFDKWSAAVEQHKSLRQNSRKVYEDRMRSKVVDQMSHQQREASQLSRLERRARLYIGATKMVGVLDGTVRRRKVRDREQVRRRVMRKYSDWSAKRKERRFFAALDQWRTAAAQEQEHKRMAEELKNRRELERLTITIQAWSSEAEEDIQRYESARIHHCQGWLDMWSEQARQLEQQEFDAANLWAVDKQRQFVKQWTISTMQHAGQAHTASKVQLKHDREYRNRVLQQWRYSCDRAMGNSPIPDNEQREAPNLFSQSLSRSSLRGLPLRRTLVKASDENQDYTANPFETPTRWTGQALPMSAIPSKSMMAPLREAEEDDLASSIAGTRMTASPAAFRRRGAGNLLDLSTTTPKAPVPTHMRNDFRPGSGGSALQLGGMRRRPPSNLLQTLGPETSELSQPSSLPRSLVPVAAATKEPPSGHQAGRLQASLPPVLGGVASRSVGLNPSRSRFSTPRSARPMSETRSVRIRSPERLSSSHNISQVQGKGASLMQQRQRNRLGG